MAKFTHGSLTRSFSFVSPMYSDSSWNKILMKILLELVVSSSFRCICDRTSHEMASVNRRWAKNFATFLNLFVSKRCIVSYVSLNICSNGGMKILLIWQNLCNYHNFTLLISATVQQKYNDWGLSNGNYFLARLIDHEETWKDTNRSGWY